MVMVKGHHREHAAVGRHHRSGDAVDERGSDERVELRVGRGVRGHGVRAVQQERGICAQSAAIDPQLDVGIEHFQEGIEVATARSGQERIDDPSLSREVAVGLRRVGNRRRGRLASCWAAASERSSVVAMSANGTPNTSCRTNASRSAGVNASSTASSANQRTRPAAPRVRSLFLKGHHWIGDVH
jgi:hypothetical protein